jgi:DNA topoisomerase-1
MTGTPNGLRFGSDTEPGIRRRGNKRFTYVDERTGKEVTKRADLERIARLAVPPAWTDVWIAADPKSHVQATGRDARGRKQYRYHPDFTAERGSNKFGELVPFAAALGRIRRRVTRDLRGDPLSQEQVIAVVVRLLDTTGLRVGNPQYARENGSYGLTTLRQRHATVRGSKLHLSFTGKSKHRFDVDVENATLARIVRRCQHMPGQRLFQYETPEGERREVSSTDVNAYLAEYGNAGITAKTFRTWNATVMAGDLFAEAASDGVEPTATSVNAVIDAVAEQLGNTRAVCRASYVHPAVLDAFVEQRLLPSWNRPVATRPSGLTVVERRVLRVLRAQRRDSVAA